MVDGKNASALLEQLVARTLTTLQAIDDTSPMHQGMALAYRDTLQTLIDQAEVLGIDRAALGLAGFK